MLRRSIARPQLGGEIFLLTFPLIEPQGSLTESFGECEPCSRTVSLVAARARNCGERQPRNIAPIPRQTRDGQLTKRERTRCKCLASPSTTRTGNLVVNSPRIRNTGT